MQHSITHLLGQIALKQPGGVFTVIVLLLHCGNHSCGDHPFTYSASHKDKVVGTKNLKVGLIRPKETFPPV
jgi:hypothetical protein